VGGHLENENMTEEQKALNNLLRITFLVVLVFAGLSLNAQTSKNNLRISGSLKLLVGLELITPEEAVLEIAQTHFVTTSDSLGNFHFNNLKPGIYNLKVIGFGYQPLDTIIKLENKSIDNLKLLIISDCGINKEIAERDIREHRPRLLLVGGIAPVIYRDENKFEKEYKVKYYDFGCNAPANECIIQYNEQIFKYLDKKYGKSWRKKVRQDVVGLKKYEKTNRQQRL
ncbi:MAG: carboxypeptidase regulatory-like domain-containing protein, partial [Bacteroidales bacterium]|nr:carboxypeptidase regulatory-like domain-containing protein [Bacteroidales bacterium]